MNYFVTDDDAAAATVASFAALWPFQASADRCRVRRQDHGRDDASLAALSLYQNLNLLRAVHRTSLPKRHA